MKAKNITSKVIHPNEIGMTQGIGRSGKARTTKTKKITVTIDRRHGREREQHHPGTSRISIQYTETPRKERSIEVRVEVAEQKREYFQRPGDAK